MEKVRCFDLNNMSRQHEKRQQALDAYCLNLTHFILFLKMEGCTLHLHCKDIKNIIFYDVV